MVQNEEAVFIEVGHNTRGRLAKNVCCNHVSEEGVVMVGGNNVKS